MACSCNKKSVAVKQPRNVGRVAGPSTAQKGGASTVSTTTRTVRRVIRRAGR